MEIIKTFSLQMMSYLNYTYKTLPWQTKMIISISDIVLSHLHVQEVKQIRFHNVRTEKCLVHIQHMAYIKMINASKVQV